MNVLQELALTRIFVADVYFNTLCSSTALSVGKDASWPGELFHELLMLQPSSGKYDVIAYPISDFVNRCVFYSPAKFHPGPI